MTDFGAFVELALESTHCFMFLRFPESMLPNRLTYFPSARKFRQRLLISTAKDKKISLSMKALEAPAAEEAEGEEA